VSFVRKWRQQSRSWSRWSHNRRRRSQWSLWQTTL